MAYNFFDHGNGILVCYNMFPAQYQNISEMKKHIEMLSKMGINALWINPIQELGDIEGFYQPDKNTGVYNEVTHSLYAMKDPQSLTPYLGDVTEVALKELTETARAYGMVPMFDCVLNHVSIDSQVCQLHPHWFQGRDPDFPDVMKFNYPVSKDEIIENLWKPYIRKYMAVYGFDGVRIDAAHLIPKEVRSEIYRYVRELSEELGKPKPVIFEEMLFEHPYDDLLKALNPKEGPTHVTSSAYYAQREWHGGMPDWTKSEEQLKAKLVFQDEDGNPRENAKGGCVNFSGNHDNVSLAMKILYEMARDQMLSLNDPHFSSENFEYLFIYSYIKDIENQIKSGNSSIIAEVVRRMKEKIVMTALTSSGGWYLLSGDEFGDLLPKSVFKRKNSQVSHFYPHRIHELLLNEDNAINSVLKELGKWELMREKGNDYKKIVYQKLSYNPDLQQRLLIPYIENVKCLINAGDFKVCHLFKSHLKKQGIITGFKAHNYKLQERSYTNGWLGNHDLHEFITKVNLQLTQLPNSRIGFWSELVRLPDRPDCAIVIRKNGFGLDSETDIVLVNCSNESDNLVLTLNDIHHIACEFQKRIIPEEKRYIGNPDFDAAYRCIMECVPKQRIHADPTITLDLKYYFSHQNMKLTFFDHQEEDTYEEDLWMIKALR